MKWFAAGPCVHCGQDNSMPCPVTGQAHERLVVEGDPPQGGTIVPQSPYPGGGHPGIAQQKGITE